MKSKKGIQLAVNFLVILIISIVLLTFGVFFLKKLVDTGNQAVTGIDQKLEQQILDEMMSKGERVFMPETAKTIREKDFDSFVIGVTNIFGESATFWIELKVLNQNVGGINVDVDLIESGSNRWLKYISEEFVLENDEGRARSIGVTPNLYDGSLAKGQYAIDAYACTTFGTDTIGTPSTACDDAFIYTPVQRFYVNVK